MSDHHCAVPVVLGLLQRLSLRRYGAHVADERHGPAWRVGEHLGLVTDRPKPRVGSRAWWLVVLGVGTVAAASVAVATRVGWL